MRTKGAEMGLFFLGFFWFAGMAVATALPIVMGARHGVALALGIAILCLVALQGLHFSAGLACAGGACGDLGALMDHIRLVLASLTGLGLVAGLGAAWMIRRREGAERG
ncbi:MAG: hypothetical protein HLUCCO07_12140 [Rhodobacteraceae bacterium HLUCCO07]|nr:MAG: hypothetical protein HLUCCO07_12140 [Rhodobacteraceae bacterium HLUCCO07]